MAYARVTFSTLRTQLDDRLKTQGNFWNQLEKDRAINEAVAIWQSMTGDHIIEITQTISDSTANLVTLVTNDTAGKSLSVLRMNQSSGPALREMHYYDLDQGFYGWRTETAASTTQRPAYWSPVGIDKIFIYPRTGASQAYRFTCYGEIAVLTAAGDYIDINEGELQRLMGMAQALLAFKEGVTEGTENANALRDLFLQVAQTRNKELQLTATYKDYMSQVQNDVEQEGAK